jgi:hypothetical protein
MLTIVVAAGLAAVPGGAAAQDSAVGTVINPSGEAGRIDAFSGPAGESPSGTATFGHIEGGLTPRWELKVTCLSVTGRTALIGFTGSYGTFIGFGESYPTAGLIRVVDGGGSASKLDSAEFASVTGEQDGPPIPGPTTCSLYPGPYPGRFGPIVNNEGDLVVKDSSTRQQARQRCVFERAAHGVRAFRARYGTGTPKRYAMRHCILLGML